MVIITKYRTINSEGPQGTRFYDKERRKERLPGLRRAFLRDRESGTKNGRSGR